MTALRDIQGVGPFLESQLYDAGYDTVAGLAAADPDDLVAVPGIGSVSARQIIAAAAELVIATRSELSVPKSTQDAEQDSSAAQKKNNKKKKAESGKKSGKAKKDKKKAKSGKKSNKAKKDKKKAKAKAKKNKKKT